MDKIVQIVADHGGLLGLLFFGMFGLIGYLIYNLVEVAKSIVKMRL